MVRFFDRSLRDGGAEAREEEPPEPPLTWFERDYAPPEPFPAAWPGRWRSAEAFPHPSVESRSWAFAAGSLPLAGSLVAEAPAEPFVERYRHRATTGTRSSLSWGAGGSPNGLARDLRPDEAFGPVFTSAPLVEPLSILGFPEVVLHLAVSAPIATAVVRLADVAPDGTTSRTGTQMRTPSRSSRAASRRSASSCAGWAIASSRVTGSGSRSHPRRGRSCGRRRSPPSSSCTAGPPPHPD